MTRWLRGLSVRARVTVLAFGTVALAVVGVALGSYLIVRAKLYQQFDAQVHSYAQLAASTDSPDEALSTLRTADDRRTDLLVQFVDPNGNPSLAAAERRALPVTALARSVADGRSVDAPETLMVAHDRYRVWTVHRADGGAAQVARDAEGIEHTLFDIGLLHVLVGVAGVAFAAFAGRRLAVAGLRPVDALTSAAERVARTQDLTARIDVAGRGETARLAEAFNSMLTALAASRAAQKRLVQDAGHELRTPMTSLRNNVELLIHAGKDPSRQLRSTDRLLADLGVQVVELSTLIDELIVLAGEEGGQPPAREEVDLAAVVASAVERVGPRAPHVRFEVTTQRANLSGEPASLERAVLNVLDNAAKWSPPTSAVQVTMKVDDEAASIAIADEGPGIADRDLPHVFKRFYRADTARSLPGSGLGLSIVEQIVEQHGGTVRATRAGSGGALVTITLPVDSVATAVS
ncbi:sensor histidine kinase [Actinocrispum wychmicini]|uniref:histidine kinase n=1 Tax=Actinocrispum wychmicini TaxID=1213861 RepID=A0A4R2JKG5_9PSEU|nr:HAMP domain-containing sensor histidine kinase [Actinocrispum wychmicini]TCO60491.1 two-component system sensor histidine kinase MprB [Actinocrispum wychmicini]